MISANALLTSKDDQNFRHSRSISPCRGVKKTGIYRLILEFHDVNAQWLQIDFHVVNEIKNEKRELSLDFWRLCFG